MLRLAKWGTKSSIGWASGCVDEKGQTSGQVDEKGQTNVVRLYEELLESPPELETPPSALFFSAVCSKKHVKTQFVSREDEDWSPLAAAAEREYEDKEEQDS